VATANPQMLIRIAANLEQLKKNLAEGKNQIEITTAAAGKLASSLDGSKLDQRAHNITAAIHSIGGATKLTDAEALRHLKTLDAWIEKGNRMGKEIPADILKTRDALKQIDDTAKAGASSGGNLLGTLTKVGGALGIAFSIGAVKTFVASVFDAAGKINDLSSQMSISTDAVQGFQFAAEQSGSSLDKVGGAITKMNDNLAGGDKGTVKALKDAGLGFQAIRAMDPEQAFLAITDAIQKIPDPMKQTEVALQLFGKAGAELLPAIKEGFRETAAAADKMSAETVKALDDAGDAWGRLSTKVTIVTGEIIAATEKGLGGMVSGIKNVTTSFGHFQVFASNVMTMGVGPALALADAWEKAAKGGAKVKDTNLELPKPLQKTKEQLDAAAAAAKKFADEYEKLSGKVSGAKAQADMKMLDDILRKLAKSGELTKTQIDAIVKEAMRLQGEGANLTERLHALALATDKLNPHLTLAKLNLKDVGEELAVDSLNAGSFYKAVKQLDDLSKSITIGSLSFGGAQESAIGKPVVPTAAKKSMWEGMFGNSAEMGAYLAQTVTGAFQGGGSAIKSALSGLGSSVMGNLGKSLVGTADAAGPLFNSALGKIFAGALPVIGSLIGPLAGAIWNKLFGTAGRDAVKDFAATFAGGFDGPGGLHEALNTLGAEGERLWIKLTQGTGRNNPAQAKATIDEITAALARQKATTAAVAQAAVDSAAAQQASLDAIAAKYDGIIGKLKGELGSFSAELQAEQDAPEFDEMGNRIYGVIELQQMKRKEKLDADIAAAEAQKDAEIAAKKDTFDAMMAAGQKVDDALRDLFGQPIKMGDPYWPGMPNGGSWGGYGGGGPVGVPTSSGRGGDSGVRASSSSPSRVSGDGLRAVNLVTPDGRTLWSWMLDQAHSEGLVR